MKRLLALVVLIAMLYVTIPYSLADNTYNVSFPCIGFTTKSNVNVRKEASAQSNLIIKIKDKDTKVTVLGSKKSGNVWWYQVDVENNKTGYIREDLLRLDANQENQISEVVTTNNSISPKSTTSETDFTILGLDEILKTIGIPSEDAKHIEKIEDWSNGPRYSFPTHGNTARVYCNMDGTVHTVKIGTDIDLFRQGYEPWSIENFLVDDITQINLIMSTQEIVTKHLKHPSTADYPLLDWSVSREFNRYTVSSSVEAKNSFGIKSKIPFTAQFWIEDKNITLVYLVIDTKVIKNTTDDYPLPERKAIGNTPEDNLTPSNEIRIIDEQLGEYGERVKLDSSEYYWYHIPAGRYKVTSNSKFCMVYVDKNKITRNSSGYVKMKNVITLNLKYGESAEISIKEDEHIFLTINADITLTPIK